MTAKIVVVSLYALMIIVIGILGLKRTKSSRDFLLGGGNIGPWMTAFSYGTAYFSAVLFIGFAGQAGWNFGISAVWIGIFNAIVGVLLVWAILGWKVKTVTTELNVSTMNEYLEKRYDSRLLRLLGSIVIFVFLIPYSAAVFMGLSYLFETSFGISYEYALAFMGVFTAVYLVLGGYKSIALIDVIFGLIMTVSVFILFFGTISEGDGLRNILKGLREIDPGLTKAVGPPGLWPLFSLVFLTSVAPFAMPHLVQKFYAIKDRKSVNIGMIISTVFAALIGCVAYFVGSTTRLFIYRERFPDLFTSAGKPIFDRLMPELLTNVVPDGLAVLILLLMLSASMSTLASLVLLSSSSFTRDFYAGFVNRKMNDRSITTMMRIMSAVFVLVSVLLAYLSFDSIVAILGISWGAIGSFFLGPFIWGLFGKRSNKYGALVSGICGLGVCLVLYFCKIPSTQAGTVGMICSFAAAPLASLATGRIVRKQIVR